jgi:phenylalanyl-tRNA synthetase beta chain
MQLPLSWIKEFIHLDSTPDEIAKMLTMAGLEVDSFKTVTQSWKGIVVGHVLEVEKHPNADKLCVATVSDGKETYQVVCGAPNCRQGMKTAFAPIDATLKDENGKEFKIKKTKIRGVESSGMLCSGKELQVSDDDDGILELPESIRTGMPLSELFSDTIFEISLTPNLGHCASVLGIARELSAITGLPLHVPAIFLNQPEPSTNSAFKVTISDPEACPRYTCRLVRNVKVGPSPYWLRSRLEKCGLRSVNNIVDITNYILMERGHPLHAFDYERLEGPEIIVKKAQEGEHFTTLDGKERTLTLQDLMICDAKRPIALAGVMGGGNSEVTEQTRHVLIESAYFDSVTIRKTSKRLGLQTDSSKRFERGTDPNHVITALNRAAMLMQEIGEGTLSSDVVDIKMGDFPEKVINCRLSRINHVLGTLFSRGEIEEIFQRLDFHYSWKEQDNFIVHVPTYRVDIQAEIDLIEEVARLYGYDNIEKKESYYQSSKLPHAPIYIFENEVRACLIAEGLQEFLTCDLIGPSLINLIQDKTMSADSLITVLNPTSIEQSILRTSLLPGLLQVVKYNIDHQNHEIGGFEIGRIHFKEGDQFKEQSIAAIILSGKSRPHHWDIKPHEYDFYDLKGIVENILGELGIANLRFENIGINTFHSGRQASIFIDSLEIGSIGEIHPAILRRLDVSQRILFGEFNLHDLIQVAQRKEKVIALSIYPGSERDWTFTIKTSVPFDQVLQCVYEQNSPLLEEVSLLDIYCSEKLGQDVQNMTLHFVYRDVSKTVSQEVVDAEHQRLKTGVLNKLGDAVKP